MSTNTEKLMTPLLSVVVPFFNQEDRISMVYDSIAGQTYKNIEIIFIDDGSVDNTFQIIQKIAQHDDRVKVISQKNMGLAGARNSGINQVTGQYITFVDGDDYYLDNDAIRNVLTTMIDEEADIGVFGFSMIEDETNRLIRSRQVGDSLATCYTGVWNKIYKSGLFSDVRFPVGYYFEDLEVTAQIMLKAHKIIVVNEPYYAYVQRPGSIVSVQDAKKHKDAFNLLFNLLNSTWFNNLDSEKKEEATAYAFHHFLAHSIVLSQYSNIDDATLEEWNKVYQMLKNNKNNSVKAMLEIQLAAILIKGHESILSRIMSASLNKYRSLFRR